MSSTKVSIASFWFKEYKGIVNTGLGTNQFTYSRTSHVALPSQAQWIFLTGENGYGKTIMLQALALTLSRRDERGIADTPYLLHKMKQEKKVTEKVNLEVGVRKGDNEPMVLSTNLGKEGDNVSGRGGVDVVDPSPFQVIAYGPSRLRPIPMSSENRHQSGIMSLFGESGVFFDLGTELAKWHANGNAPTVGSYYQKPVSIGEKLLKTTVPGIEQVIYNPTKSSRVEYRIATGAEEEEPELVDWTQLSAGYRSLIALVGDIYLRLSGYEPEVDITTFEFPEPEALFGFVVVDELELHLHPKWQKALPQLLSNVFPNVQFIASTHSPIPLIGSPEHSVFLKVYKQNGQGIQVERLLELETEIRDMLPNAVFSSPLFGFEDQVSEAHDPERRIRTEDSYTDVKFYDEVRSRLMARLSPERQKELQKHFNSGAE